LRVAVVLLLLASCRREAVATRPHDKETPRAEKVVEGLPRVRVLGDIAEHHGKRVVVDGLYEVEPIARGKGGKRVWLVLVDGTRISRAYDAIKTELAFANRRVHATGTITSGPPDTHIQALMAPHLALEKLELAASEPPLASDVTEIPAPPVASTTAPLAKQLDRWVQLVGTLTALTGDDATIKLADGAVVRVERVHTASYAPHLGKTVTVTGRLAMEKGTGGAFALDLVIRGPTAICAGVVARCGM